ncbi:hypothetical protein NLX71_26295, partial [Paenibacillus sp. MZ04-78.2]|uniref:hypothetical protein n=1 Tax=Paenibacillus sp. MZ04-78.2 TaxID=2962034 RepID=UPI0020B7255B
TSLQKNLRRVQQRFWAFIRYLNSYEIISYMKHSFLSKIWKDPQHWIGSAIIHPSSRYLEYLLNILSEEDTSAPHYWALDAIQYMPEDISELALPELKKLSKRINPSWSAAVVEKYFETIVWIDENAEDFIATLVSSPSELVTFRAKYWMETFEAERKEDEED